MTSIKTSSSTALTCSLLVEVISLVETTTSTLSVVVASSVVVILKSSTSFVCLLLLPILSITALIVIIRTTVTEVIHVSCTAWLLQCVVKASRATFALLLVPLTTPKRVVASVPAVPLLTSEPAVVVVEPLHESIDRRGINEWMYCIDAFIQKLNLIIFCFYQLLSPFISLTTHPPICYP